MKKNVLLSLAIVSFIHCLSAQSWVWGADGNLKGGGSGYGGVAIDNKTNVYLVGTFPDSLLFGKDTLLSDYYQLPFLAKYDSNGNYLWSVHPKKYNTYNDDDAFTAVTDKNNNVYVGGDFAGTLIFGNDSLNSLNNTARSPFIAKYASDGTYKWARQGKPMAGQSLSVYCANDNAGNVFLSGVMTDSTSFGPYKLASYFGLFAFLVKYDSNGNVLWARQSTGSYYGNTQPYAVTTDTWGNVYMTGVFGGITQFGTTVLKATVVDDFMTKYDKAGNLLWAKAVVKGSSISNAQASSLAIASDKLGNLIITGTFTDTLFIGNDTLVNPSNPNSDFFIAKYDSSGKAMWSKKGTQLDNNEWLGSSVTADSSENIYAIVGIVSSAPTGSTKVAFDNDTIRATGTWDSFILLKLDPNGNLLCYSMNRSGTYSRVVTDPSGQHVYVGGRLWSDAAIFGKDTMQKNSAIRWPFVARWQSCEESTEGIRNLGSTIQNTLIYPNPNNGRFILRLPQIIGSNSSDRYNEVEIYDVLGEKVYSSSLPYAETEINLQNQSRGIYLYRIISKEGSQLASSKFIIE